MAFTPVVFYKGDETRVARTAVIAVELEYDGWVADPSAVPPPLPTFISSRDKGVPGGVAALDGAGNVLDGAGNVLDGVNDGEVAALVGSKATATGAAVAASVPVAVRALPRSQMVGPGYGFAIEQWDAGHIFLGYGPAGEIVAGLRQSNGGRTIGKSTDGGATWTTLGTPSVSNSPGGFWYSSAGTWFVYASGQLYRSADSGVTWAKVADTGTLLCQSFADAGGGTLWAAEYLGDARVFRSTDDGLTWSVVYNFANTDNPADVNPVIRHIHGIAKFTSGIWCFTGDMGTHAGLWKWDGAKFIRQSPLGPSVDQNQEWRAVGVIERGGWLYWVQDGASAASTQRPGVFKADQNNLAGTITRLGTLPTGGWYAKRLSTGEIVLGSIAEPGGGGLEADFSTRLWVIDNADHVHEVLHVPYLATAGNTDFPGVRSLDVYNDVVGFVVNNTGPSAASYTTIRGRVITGGATLSVSRATTPRLYADTARAWSAAGTGSATVTGSAFADMPGLAVTVNAGARPLRVSLTTDMRNNTAGQYTNVRLVAVNALTGGVTNIGSSFSYGAQTYGTMSIVGLFAPTTPGTYIIKAQWSASGTSTGDLRFGWCTLVVDES